MKDELQQYHKAIVLVLVSALLVVSVYGVFTYAPEYAPAMLWSKILGGVYPADSPFLVETSDGGCLAGGFLANGSQSFAVKLDAAGNVQWNRTYSGLLQYVVSQAEQTSDGGYIMSGWAYGKVNSTVPGDYAWLMKTAADGAPQWNRTYGVDPSYAIYVEQTTDGGYVFGGVFNSLAMTPSARYIWLVKIDSNGLLEWNRTYGGFNITYGFARFVHQTEDGGYVVAGGLYFNNSGEQYFLLKTDSAGDMEWNHTYSLGYDNTESYAASTSDGGYVIAGMTSQPGSAGGYATFLVRTSGDGTLVWQKTYGAGWPDVKQTSDGGYVLAGDWTDPNTKLVQPLLVKLNDNGTEQWTKSNWENHPQGALYESVVQSQDGGYVLGALSPIIGQSDQVVEAFWIAKLASTPTYEESPVFLYFAAISTVEGVVLLLLAIVLIKSAVSRRDRPAGY